MDNMRYTSLGQFMTTQKAALAKGPIAIVLVEDDVEVDTTLRHHLQLGFAHVLALMPAVFDLPRDLQATVHRIDFDLSIEGATETAVNAIINAAPGQWIYYCYNVEYLFYPFCETRAITEMLAFHTEERRDSMLTYIIDLYTDDLDADPDAVSLERAHLDRSGYYALARPDMLKEGHPKERQLDFYGGLRWRYEEHVPSARRKIDRISIFRATNGLKLREEHTFSDE
jgi:hypothetical protein